MKNNISKFVISILKQRYLRWKRFKIYIFCHSVLVYLNGNISWKALSIKSNATKLDQNWHKLALTLTYWPSLWLCKYQINFFKHLQIFFQNRIMTHAYFKNDLFYWLSDQTMTTIECCVLIYLFLSLFYPICTVTKVYKYITNKYITKYIII